MQLQVKPLPAIPATWMGTTVPFSSQILADSLGEAVEDGPRTLTSVTHLERETPDLLALIIVIM